MREAWKRTSVTQMALVVHVATTVEERHCWALARAVWGVVAPGAAAYSVSLSDAGSSTSPPPPPGHWSDRCGFYRARLLEDLLRDDANAATRRAFNDTKPKALDGLLRKAMVEAASLVW